MMARRDLRLLLQRGCLELVAPDLAGSRWAHASPQLVPAAAAAAAAAAPAAAHTAAWGGRPAARVGQAAAGGRQGEQQRQRLQPGAAQLLLLHRHAWWLAAGRLAEAQQQQQQQQLATVQQRRGLHAPAAGATRADGLGLPQGLQQRHASSLPTWRQQALIDAVQEVYGADAAAAAAAAAARQAEPRQRRWAPRLDAEAAAPRRRGGGGGGGGAAGASEPPSPLVAELLEQAGTSSGGSAAAAAPLARALALLSADPGAAAAADVRAVLDAHAAAGVPLPQHEAARLLQRWLALPAAASCPQWDLLAVAAAAQAARVPGWQEAMRPELYRRLRALVADLRGGDGPDALAAAPAAAAAGRLQPAARDALQLLGACEFAGFRPPRDAVELLLPLMAGSPELLRLPEINAVLFAAGRAGAQEAAAAHGAPLLERALQLLLACLGAAQPREITRLLHSFENGLAPVPAEALLRLAERQTEQLAACSWRDGVRLLRSAAFAGVRLPPAAAHGAVQLLLDGGGGGAGGGAAPRSALLIALRSVSTAGQPLSEGQLEALVSRVLALQPPGGLSPDDAAVALKAVACLRQERPPQEQLKALLQPLLRGVRAEGRHELIPPVLLSLSRLELSLPEGVAADLLRLAHDVLARHAGAGGQPRDGQQQQRRPAPGAVADLLKALVHHDSPVPEDLTPPLADAFLSQSPRPRELCSFLCSVAAMGRPLRAAQVEEVQRRLSPPEAMRQLGSADAGNLLRGAASMGFAFAPGFVARAAGQLLATPKPPATFTVAQTLWAAASGGASQALPDALMRRLLGAVLDEQRQLQLHDDDGADADADADAEAAAAAAAAADAEAEAAPPAAGGLTAWQLSLAAWAAALCDARGCEDQVLELCGLLARPAPWRVLRVHELVQLAMVHQWLCGYTWRDDAGLAAVLSPRQLGRVKAARQWQVLGTSGKAALPEGSRLARLAAAAAATDCGQGRPDAPPLPGPPGAAGAAAAPPLQVLPGQRPPWRVGPSFAQLGLHRVAQRLPGLRRVVLEQLTDDGLMCVDVVAETAGGVRVAIEYDGPFHFAVQIPEPGGGGGGALVPTRTTLFRNRALAARGYAVVCVPFAEWDALGASAARQAAHLQQLIDEAVAAEAERQQQQQPPP